MVQRLVHLRAVEALLRRNRVVAILGARQVGKTTLARQVARRWRGSVVTYDLEDPRDVAALAEPMLALEPARGLVILDEIQRRPDLFAALRVLADRPKGARFLVLGSAAPDLLRQSWETLAGRIAFHELPPLSLGEAGVGSAQRLWLRGGFPRSFTARSDRDSAAWRRAFVRTFIERDLGQTFLGIPAATLGRFWTMVAHYHAQIWNASELARAFGMSDVTVRRYLDMLAATFVVRVLPPWHENMGKRQVKAPKIYVSDSGLLHTLLEIEDRRHLDRHPKVGASWEGFGLEAVIRHLGARREECYFWATHQGAEIDLVVVRGRHRRGFEFKRTDAPTLTPSMRIALEDLELRSVDVVHPGARTFTLAPGIRAVSIGRLLEDVELL